MLECKGYFTNETLQRLFERSTNVILSPRIKLQQVKTHQSFHRRVISSLLSNKQTMSLSKWMSRLLDFNERQFILRSFSFLKDISDEERVN